MSLTPCSRRILQRLGHGAAGSDHVVDHQHIFAFDFADDVFGFDGAAALAALVDEAELAAEQIGINLGAFNVADVGRDENSIGQASSS